MGKSFEHGGLGSRSPLGLQVGRLDMDVHIIIIKVGGDGGIGVGVGIEDGIVSVEPKADFAMEC